MALTAADIKVRTQSVPTSDDSENSFASLADLSAIIKFRVDAGAWDLVSEDPKVRFVVSAYNDLMKLAWSRANGRSQSRDYEFPTNYAGGATADVRNWPPVEDIEFSRAVKKAQAAQIMYLVNGSHVRDMAREGLTMSRGLVGAEMWFTGYRGPVCVEAIEHIARWIELAPKMRRI